MSERTFTIIKPDSVAKGNTGRILAHLESDGFTVVAGRRAWLSETQAREFYAEHRERPFYDSLVAFMTSGPVWVMALERDNAIARLREVMGATDPAEAADGTIRKLYAESKERNAIHGSDSPTSAARELAFFFPTSALL